MSENSEEPKPKKQRSGAAAGDVEDEAKASNTVANDLFQNMLRSLQAKDAKNSSSSSFRSEFSSSRHITRVMKELKKLADNQLKKEKENRQQIQKKYSRLNQIDRSIQISILGWLDEESLQDLEHSKVLDLGLDEEETEKILIKQWEFLCTKRQRHGFPERVASFVSDEGLRGYKFGYGMHQDSLVEWRRKPRGTTLEKNHPLLERLRLLPPLTCGQENL